MPFVLRRQAKALDRTSLLRWQRSRRGRRILAIEQVELRAVLPDLFGRHLLQIGNWARGRRLLASSRMLHRAVLGNCEDATCQARIDLEQLPLATHSVDAVLLPHTLEFVASPHRLLREVDRVLTGRGQVVILGFNPWSLWGAREWLGLHHHAYPPGAVLRSIGRLYDWLSLLDFEVTRVRRFTTMLPALSRFPYVPGAGGYLLVAQKRVVPMTLVGQRSRAQVRPIIGASLPLSRTRTERE